MERKTNKHQLRSDSVGLSKREKKVEGSILIALAGGLMPNIRKSEAEDFKGF